MFEECLRPSGCRVTTNFAKLTLVGFHSAGILPLELELRLGRWCSTRSLQTVPNPQESIDLSVKGLGDLNYQLANSVRLGITYRQTDFVALGVGAVLALGVPLHEIS